MVRIPAPRSSLCKGPQPAWMISLKPGHVIQRPGSRFRVVREVSRYRNGELRSVTLAIRHCSWTGRCYTILNASDLRILGYRRVPAKRRTLRQSMDRKFAKAVSQRCDVRPFVLTCCDVESLP